jgi:SulP family sulfate permease
MFGLGKSVGGKVLAAPEKPFRFNINELGGAMGDLGVLLPLSIALITLNHMNPTSVFLVVGLAYIVAGFFFRLPIPVQPLKAVAAIAIAGGLSAGVISAAGMIMAVILLLLAVTGTINIIAKLFPRAIIRGIQLGVGLLLLKTGLLLVTSQQVVIGGGEESVAVANLSIPISILLAIFLGGVFFFLLRSKKLPASLVIIGLGVMVGVFWGSINGIQSLQLGLSLPIVAMPSLDNLYLALVLLVIPQLPLTLGNAVFASADTAKTYFGSRAKRVTPKALLTSMGTVNLGASLVGGMPICHGSGGITAHYRLGARTGGAALMVGIPFLLLALFVDGNILPIISLIPYSALGVLVIFVGVKHALLAKDLKNRGEILVAFMVGIIGMITANLSLGLLSGLSLYLVLKIMDRIARHYKTRGKTTIGENRTHDPAL